MQTYTVIVFGAVGLFILIGILSTFTRGNSLYDQIGRGGLSLEGDDGGGDLSDSSAAAHSADVEREQEIRQMLQARSDRQVRSGGEPLDVEAELSRLARAPSGSPGKDPALAGEVRQLVIARNERRLRQGLEPLDVEGEVRRTLQELAPEG
jgi:hypothetical protein